MNTCPQSSRIKKVLSRPPSPSVRDQVRPVVLVTNIPTPYRVPLFNALNNTLEQHGLYLIVIFAAWRYPRRQWQLSPDEFEFEYRVLRSKRIDYTSTERVSFTYRGLFSLLKTLNPDLIITSGFSLATTLIAWGRQAGLYPPFLIWTEGICQPVYARSWLRSIQRRVLVHRSDGCIVSGGKAAAYMKQLGAPEQSIFKACSTTDTEAFIQNGTRHRQQHSRPPSRKFRLLAISHLTPDKGIELLFPILSRLLHLDVSIHLDIVGDGPHADRLEQETSRSGISQHVTFWGYRQKKDLFGFLASADCFVFPTRRDVWGMVLLEAMAAGLPCLASPHAGATSELIQDEINGYVCDFNVESTCERILFLKDNPAHAARIGRKAQQTIREDFSLDNAVAGFFEAIQCTLG